MEVVKGYVILDVTRNFKPHEVKLRFIGQERTLGSKSDSSMQLRQVFSSGVKDDPTKPTVETVQRRTSECLTMDESIKYKQSINMHAKESPQKLDEPLTPSRHKLTLGPEPDDERTTKQTKYFYDKTFTIFTFHRELRKG